MPIWDGQGTLNSVSDRLHTVVNGDPGPPTAELRKPGFCCFGGAVRTPIPLLGYFRVDCRFFPEKKVERVLGNQVNQFGGNIRVTIFTF